MPKSSLTNHPLLHRAWWVYENFTVGQHMWVWRPLCWVICHEPTWNCRRTYCVVCLKDLSRENARA